MIAYTSFSLASLFFFHFLVYGVLSPARVVYSNAYLSAVLNSCTGVYCFLFFVFFSGFWRLSRLVHTVQ